MGVTPEASHFVPRSPIITDLRKSDVFSFPSPRWSDCSMVLPLEIATLISISAPVRAQPPTMPVLKELDKSQPRIIASRISVPMQTARISLQDAIAVNLQEPGPSESQAEQDAQVMRSSPTLPAMDLVSNPRRSSLVSTSISVASIDLDKIPIYTHTDAASEVYTVDYQESDYGDAASAPTTATTPELSSAHTKRHQSAELSLRADMILANAKKRLNLLDQNLRGARALTRENLQRAASMNAHRASYTSRFLRAEETSANRSSFSDSSDDTTEGGPITLRRTVALTRPERADQSLLERSRMYDVPTRRLLRPSRSQDLPRSSTDFTCDQAATNPIDHFPSPTASRQSSDSTGVVKTDALRKQMEHLNRRVSVLRNKTREDNARRQSLQHSQPSSPFTNAGQDRALPTTSTGATELSANATSALSSLTADATGPPSPDLSHAPIHQMVYVEHQQELSPTKDWSPVRPQTTETHTVAYSKHHNSKGRADMSLAVMQPAPQPHEDRIDAFDYEHFFLHSSLGRIGTTTVDDQSEASEDTARGVGRDADGQDSTWPGETPEKLANIERGLYKRYSSFASDDSNVSFATAMSALRSRQVSPEKLTGRTPSPHKLHGSRSTDSGVGMFKKPVYHQRHTSAEVADQVSHISAPVATIAVAALAAHATSTLSLRDKALVHMLMDSSRAACEKLLDPNTPGDEARLVRNRLQRATKVLEGLTSVEL